MFISGISIENYRLFGAETPFEINGFNVPDGSSEGSGINIFVGENGCGKTTLLEALALPILEYKSDSFALEDMNDTQKGANIFIFAEKISRYKEPCLRAILTQKDFSLKQGLGQGLLEPTYLQSL